MYALFLAPVKEANRKPAVPETAPAGAAAETASDNEDAGRCVSFRVYKAYRSIPKK